MLIVIPGPETKTTTNNHNQIKAPPSALDPSPMVLVRLRQETGEVHVGVSENSGTPKSSILIGFSIINHPFWGTTIFGNTHVDMGWGLRFTCLVAFYHDWRSKCQITKLPRIPSTNTPELLMTPKKYEKIETPRFEIALTHNFKNCPSDYLFAILFAIRDPYPKSSLKARCILLS